MSGKQAKLKRREQRLRNLESQMTEGLRRFAKEGFDVPWTPFEPAELPNGGLLDDMQFDSCWVNSRYQVFVRFVQPEMPGWPIMVHLSIKSHDREPHHDWRDFQRLKNELVGTDSEALEVYPAEARLVDEANQFHLWCFPPGERLPFGARDRNVNGPGAAAETGARQREFAEHHGVEGCTPNGRIGWPETKSA
jgi:hypothetical protein